MELHVIIRCRILTSNLLINSIILCRKYLAEVSFLEMPTSVSPSVTTSDVLKKLVCREKCFVCSQGIDLNHLVSDDNYGEEDPGHQSAKPRWRTRLDSFHSIGAAVMSCRNDKAPDGLSAHAHLADGLLHLILIKSCSRPNYLRYGFCMRLTFVPL